MLGFFVVLLAVLFHYLIFQIAISSFPPALQFQANLKSKNTELPVLSKSPFNSLVLKSPPYNITLRH